MRILVVDDDSLAGEMTAAVLEEQGHTTLTADDAMAAIELLEQHTDIELIVSDMHMPLVNGIELVEMLREQQVTLPFILLTGDTPSPALSNHPALAACLMKDAALMDTLANAIDATRIP